MIYDCVWRETIYLYDAFTPVSPLFVSQFHILVIIRLSHGCGECDCHQFW